MSQYHVFTDGDTAVTTRARKETAVKFGETLGTSFRVVTDSGKVVHESNGTEAPTDEEPTTPEAEAPAKGKPSYEPVDGVTRKDTGKWVRFYDAGGYEVGRIRAAELGQVAALATAEVAG